MSEITSLAEIVRVHGRDRAAHTAIIQGERTLTWAELYERACCVAHALADVGVGSQDRVAFLDKNGIEHFEVFFGASLLNAVCVDVNWRLAAPEVEYIVNDSEAKVFVVGPDFVPILDTIAANLSSVDTIVVIGGHERYESFADWVGRYPALDPGATSELDDVAFQLYSSGTTGRPEGGDARATPTSSGCCRWPRTSGSSRPTPSISSRCRCSTSVAAGGRRPECTRAARASSCASSTRRRWSGCSVSTGSPTRSWCRSRSSSC